jgi:MFS family permease
MDRTLDRPVSTYRWNFAAFILDYAFFTVAVSFASPTSVLPAFVSQFTQSAPIIGMVSTVWNGCWLLPQVVAARAINDKPRKKPYLMVGLSGRVAFWIVALALWLGLGQHPSAMLILFFVCLALFALPDGLASIAWFDMLARAIPVERRGRLMGIAQVISGLAGIGVGAALSFILDSPSIPFPTNYVMIFVLAGVAFIPSTVALALLREVGPEKSRTQTGEDRPDGWLKPLREDPTFRRLMACRVLAGMVSLATPFYVAHATDVLNLSLAVVGSFVAAQQVAGVAFGALLGLVSERWGPTATIRIGSGISVFGPLFALAAHVADGGVLTRAYPVVYVAFAAYQSSTMLGFYNYMLEIAPDSVRPSYVGLGNTIMGILTLAPTLGGWLLEATSYIVLFGVTAGLASLGTLIAMSLKPAMELTDEAGLP